MDLWHRGIEHYDSNEKLGHLCDTVMNIEEHNHEDATGLPTFWLFQPVDATSELPDKHSLVSLMTIPIVRVLDKGLSPSIALDKSLLILVSQLMLS